MPSLPTRLEKNTPVETERLRSGQTIMSIMLGCRTKSDGRK